MQGAVNDCSAHQSRHCVHLPFIGQQPSSSRCWPISGYGPSKVKHDCLKLPPIQRIGMNLNRYSHAFYLDLHPRNDERGNFTRVEAGRCSPKYASRAGLMRPRSYSPHRIATGDDLVDQRCDCLVLFDLDVRADRIFMRGGSIFENAYYLFFWLDLRVVQRKK
jgi:hypothetical protein